MTRRRARPQRAVYHGPFLDSGSSCYSSIGATYQPGGIVGVVTRFETKEERERRERQEAERRVREERSRLYAEGRTPWPTPPRDVPLVDYLTRSQWIIVWTLVLYGLLCITAYMIGM